jgi:hypothetical protein
VRGRYKERVKDKRVENGRERERKAENKKE